jgi:excisionase family DNA binding protein
MKKQASMHVGTSMAAKMLSHSVATVQKLVDAGKLSAYVTEGGHRRISYASLMEYKKNLMKTHTHSDDVGVFEEVKPDEGRGYIGVVSVQAEEFSALTATSENPQYCLITDPMQLLEQGKHIRHFFMDARLPWMNWQGLSMYSGKYQLVIYNAKALPDGAVQHLVDIAELTSCGISNELLEGYRMGCEIHGKAHHGPYN